MFWTNKSNQNIACDASIIVGKNLTRTAAVSSYVGNTLCIQ